MKKLIPILLFVFGFIIANGQNTSTFNGTVNGYQDKPLTGAAIHILNTNYTTTTDAAGKFSFAAIATGRYIVNISAAGYAAQDLNITITGGAPGVLTAKLLPANIQLNEVTVTAQKREEDPQKIAASLTVLSSKQVEDYNLKDAKDLTAIVPNLYSANSGDNRNVTGIRGIATTSYDPAIAVNIDGVNQYGLDTYISELFDVDRIEVLRGPQGTLYGRNALGGVINIITKQPTNTFNGFANVDIANYGQQRYTLGFRAPLVNDKLYLGVAAQYFGMNGFYTNLYNNSHFDKQHYFLGNYYLKYLVTPRFTLTANLKNLENRNDGPFPQANSIAEALAQPFKLDQNAITNMHDNTLQASLTASYTGAGFNFTSQSSFQANKRTYESPIDGDGSPIDGISIVNNYGGNYNREQTAIQEFRFMSPASSTSAIKWTAGTYGFYHYSPDKQGVHFGADAADVGSPQTDFTTIATNVGHNYGIAAYGQATYTISPLFDLTAGIRYDYEHKELSINGQYQPDGQAPITTQGDTTGRASFRAFTPKLNLAYHAGANNLLYVGYSRGFRAGGISELGSDPTQPPLYAYKPEYSDNYEAGSKNTFWDNKLRLNFTIFYSLVTDAQVPTLLLPQAYTITQNAGRLSSKGAELELAATPLKGLEIDYNFGYTHARYTDLVVPDNNGSTISLKGNHQVFTPDVTSMLALQYGYDLNPAQNLKLVGRLEWRYLGDQYFDLANQNEQKAYSLFNARLGIANKRFNVFLYSTNLGNKHYVDYAYDFGAAHLGNPRVTGVSAGVNF